jgi:ribonuclease T1
MLRNLRFLVFVVLAIAGVAQAFQWQAHGRNNQQNQAMTTQPNAPQAAVPSSASDGIALAALPSEARDTLHDIKQGGPFEFDRDGVVFGNFEKILPKQARGYYHEYTVKTPGVRSRGARRIIEGANHEYFYTDDHYQTFKKIRE